MATSTATETLHTTEGIPLEILPPQAAFKGSRVSKNSFENAPILEPALTREASTPPEDAFEAKEKWNSPPINKYRVFSTFWSFFVLGMNDGSYGVSASKFFIIPGGHIVSAYTDTDCSSSL